MKALRSLLARQVLADPKARVILREAAASPEPGDHSPPTVVELRVDGRTQTFQPILVRRAA